RVAALLARQAGADRLEGGEQRRRLSGAHRIGSQARLATHGSKLMTSANFLAAQWPQVSSGPSGRQDDQARAAWQIFIMAVLAEYMCAALRHQLDRSERSIHEDAGRRRALSPPSIAPARSRRIHPFLPVQTHIKDEDAGSFFAASS